jgi:hypothetical protein
MEWREYKEAYQAEYNKFPGFKCIMSFLRLYPLKEIEPTPEEYWQEPEPTLPKFRVRRVDIEENIITVCK